MEIIIDKKDYSVVKTSYGYFVDDEGINYLFSVDINETDGEQKWIEISWDDDIPKNIDDVVSNILDKFCLN
jgi:hypothetical protein